MFIVLGQSWVNMTTVGYLNEKQQPVHLHLQWEGGPVDQETVSNALKLRESQVASAMAMTVTVTSIWLKLADAGGSPSSTFLIFQFAFELQDVLRKIIWVPVVEDACLEAKVEAKAVNFKKIKLGKITTPLSVPEITSLHIYQFLAMYVYGIVSGFIQMIIDMTTGVFYWPVTACTLLQMAFSMNALALACPWDCPITSTESRWHRSHDLLLLAVFVQLGLVLLRDSASGSLVADTSTAFRFISAMAFMFGANVVHSFCIRPVWDNAERVKLSRENKPISNRAGITNPIAGKTVRFTDSELATKEAKTYRDGADNGDIFFGVMVISMACEWTDIISNFGAVEAYQGNCSKFNWGMRTLALVNMLVYICPQRRFVVSYLPDARRSARMIKHIAATDVLTDVPAMFLSVICSAFLNSPFIAFTGFLNIVLFTKSVIFNPIFYAVVDTSHQHKTSH
jgi:hypothetical protein